MVVIFSGLVVCYELTKHCGFLVTIRIRGYELTKLCTWVFCYNPGFCMLGSVINSANIIMSRHTSAHSERVFTVTKILNKDDQKQNMCEKPKIKA